MFPIFSQAIYASQTHLRTTLMSMQCWIRNRYATLLSPSSTCFPQRTCTVPMIFVLVMGAEFARTMAWKAHGKSHDELMTQLRREYITV